MTRRTETVIVPEWGRRDRGKTFKITEWSAAQAEWWGERMFLCLKGNDGFLPPNVAQLGMVGVSIAGINAFLKSDPNPAALRELLDEMLECVSVVRDPKHPDTATPISSDDDIEEVQTRLWLRSEVLRVHTDFSVADALSNLASLLVRASAATSSDSQKPSTSPA